ncbi:beta-lactamase family protein [Solirubrobacter sp. CPCC 204708]|uniref:Beta-lactamase family protein n=1 Tax=Solirubrobacter deserti TaxID=2282478 RepID=A0ABT4RUP7_9ACTN|nr:serine hydrolase domain-containing protein [Solirubrobacter deserti]MBE2320967.1 beta-lactamase family protein [Solirubrobacter deserti]MDA0142261.1 beta-lactamase family protein [Solirubrobacter deserti]
MKTIGVRHAGETTFDGDPDAVYEIGSLTKPFTARLLALLVDEGLVTLDEPVVDGRAFTFRQLAEHRSGLPRLPKKTGRWNRRDPYAEFTDEVMPSVIAATTPKHEPGTEMVYSNFGYGLLGYALAQRASTSYAELVRAHITQPLEMTQTALDTPGLVQGRDFFGRATPPWHLAALAGAGGLRSTASDMLRFLAAEAERPSLAWRKAPGKHQMWMHDGGTGGFRSFAVIKADTQVIVLHAKARRVNGDAFKALRAAEAQRSTTAVTSGHVRGSQRIERRASASAMTVQAASTSSGSAA